MPTGGQRASSCPDVVTEDAAPACPCQGGLTALAFAGGISGQPPAQAPADLPQLQGDARPKDLSTLSG